MDVDKSIEYNKRVFIFITIGAAVVNLIFFLAVKGDLGIIIISVINAGIIGLYFYLIKENLKDVDEDIGGAEIKKWADSVYF